MDRRKHYFCTDSIFFYYFKGDVVDRGPDTIRLYKMLKRLRKEAEKAGGQVNKIKLFLGNKFVRKP